MKTMFRLSGRLLLLAFILLGSAAVSEAQPGVCWCDPRYDWSTFQHCNTNWEVVHTGLLGFVPTCSGTPPACVGLAITQNADNNPDGIGYLLLEGGGFATPRGIPCIPIIDFGTPISIYPNGMPKQALRPILMDNYRQIVYWQGQLRNLPEGSPAWRAAKLILNGILVTTARLVLRMYDPPNADYAHLPPVPVFTAQELAVAGTGVTQATADAINAWETKSRKLHQYEAQLSQSFDNLSGAILAYQAGDSAAAPWIWSLARWIDAITPNIAAKGIQEVAARSAIAATLPSSAVPAGCMTMTELTARTVDLTTFGADPLWGLFMLHQDMHDQSGLCLTGTTMPALMTNGAQARQDAYATLPTDIRAAQAVCTAVGICGTPTTTTVTPQATQQDGWVKQKIKVTPAPPDGSVVHVSMTLNCYDEGCPLTYTWAPDPILTAGIAKVSVPAMWGTWVLTATYPEQQPMLNSSTTTVNVVVNPVICSGENCGGQ